MEIVYEFINMKELAKHKQRKNFLNHLMYSINFFHQQSEFIKIILRKFKNILSDLSVAIRLNLVLQLTFIIDCMVYWYLYLKNLLLNLNIKMEYLLKFL